MAIGPTSGTGLRQSIYYAPNIVGGSNTVTVVFNQTAAYPDVRVLVTAKGGPEVLKLVEEDLPEPQAGWVRVRVLAAGVAFADILIRRGLPHRRIARPGH